MKNKGKVSVVVPLYNTEKYIINCIESIRNQTYKDIEVLIIDDGSTDASGKVVKEYLENIDDKRVKYFYKENEGVGKARNYGMALATGKYISFIDSDDTIEETFYEKLVKKINDKISFVMTSYFNKIDGDKKEIIKVLKKNIKLFKSPSCCLKLFNLNKIKKYNILFEDSYLGEDLEFTVKLMINNDKFKIVKAALYNYYRRDNSLTHTYNENMLTLKSAIDRIETYAKENKKYNKFKKRLEYMNISHVLIALMKRVQHLENFKNDVMYDLIDYVSNKYPNWYKNKYINKTLSLEEIKYLSGIYLKDEKIIFSYLNKYSNY